MFIVYTAFLQFYKTLVNEMLIDYSLTLIHYEKFIDFTKGKFR